MNRRIDNARRELADLVLRACAAGGAAVGLLAGVSAGPGEPHARQPGTGAVGRGVWEAMSPILASTVVGAVAGMALGVVLALAIRPRS